MPPHDFADAGLVTLPSAHTVSETVVCLKAVLAEKGIHLFAHIDHAAEAANVGLSLRPTQVLIFGNPKAGTPLMQSEQIIGLDLPLRMLVWEDVMGHVWLTYTEPHYMARHYRITDREKEVTALGASLTAVVHAVTSPPEAPASP